MILDHQNLFSEDQAITATAASTNVIDGGDAIDKGRGEPVGLLCQVTEDFDNLTNLTIKLQESSDNSSFTDVAGASVTVALASLVQGYKFPLKVLPSTSKRYLRMHYTVSGSAPTAGKITAGLTPAIQDWQALPDAL